MNIELGLPGQMLSRVLWRTRYRKSQIKTMSPNVNKLSAAILLLKTAHTTKKT